MLRAVEVVVWLVTEAVEQSLGLCWSHAAAASLVLCTVMMHSMMITMELMMESGRLRSFRIILMRSLWLLSSSLGLVGADLMMMSC